MLSRDSTRRCSLWLRSAAPASLHVIVQIVLLAGEKRIHLLHLERNAKGQLLEKSCKVVARPVEYRFTGALAGLEIPSVTYLEAQMNKGVVRMGISDHVMLRLVGACAQTADREDSSRERRLVHCGKKRRQIEPAAKTGGIFDHDMRHAPSGNQADAHSQDIRVRAILNIIIISCCIASCSAAPVIA